MKSRSWTFLIYEDSAPSNWKEIVEKWYIPVSISPLHDKDKYTSDIIDEDTGEIKHKKGEIKKPHRHVLISFQSPTTYKNALSYAEKLGAQYIERVGVLKAAYEYHTHKNNKEKYQYDENEIININGFDAALREDPVEIERKKILIIDKINEEKIKEYNKIYDYYRKRGEIDFCEVVSKNTIFINAYLKSKKFSIDEDIIK